MNSESKCDKLFKMSFFSKKNLLIILTVGLFFGLFFLLLNQSQPKEYLFSYNPYNDSDIQESVRTKNSSLNLLLLGIVGEGSRGQFATDTILVTHLDFTNKKIALISIPRDLWVRIPNSSQETKINGLYAMENRGKKFSQATKSSLITKKAEEITGLKIDETVILELEGFGKLIDAIGGIDIWLETDVYDPLLINPHKPTEIFHLAAGWRHLDGDLAIKFVRSRYAPEGDFYRMRHQQQIIAALKNKLTKLADVWNLVTWLKIWQSLNNHIIADLDFNALWNIFNLIKDISTDEMEYLQITNRPPDELLFTTTYTSESSAQDIYILIPREGFEKYQKIQEYIKEKISS